MTLSDFKRVNREALEFGRYAINSCDPAKILALCAATRAGKRLADVVAMGGLPVELDRALDDWDDAQAQIDAAGLEVE